MATGVLVRYPTGLPGPTAAPLTPTERRLASEVPGPVQYRGVQRDFHARQRVQFMLTADQAEAWQTWWRADLMRGGLWFAANWPLMQGRTDNVYRFAAPPTWDFIPGGPQGRGMRRVSALLEVRGRGAAPRRYLPASCPIVSSIADSNTLALWRFDQQPFSPDVSAGGFTPGWPDWAAPLLVDGFCAGGVNIAPNDNTPLELLFSYPHADALTLEFSVVFAGENPVSIGEFPPSIMTLYFNGPQFTDEHPVLIQLLGDGENDNYMRMGYPFSDFWFDFPLADWVHIAFVISGDNFEIYADGVYVGRLNHDIPLIGPLSLNTVSMGYNANVTIDNARISTVARYYPAPSYQLFV